MSTRMICDPPATAPHVPTMASSNRSDLAPLRVLGWLLGSLLTGFAVRADIVISEVFYNQPGSVETAEFVEVHNSGTETVDLSGWSFSEGIQFTFRDGQLLRAGDYVCVVADLGAFLEEFPAGRSVGEYVGRLSNGGERLALFDGQAIVDLVDYNDDEDWPSLADGEGASLELISVTESRCFPGNWAAGLPPTPSAENGAAGQPVRPMAYNVRVPDGVTSNDTALISARAYAPGGFDRLYARLDVDGVVTEVDLADGGEDGDERAGDGRYSANAPSYPSTTLAKFKVVMRVGEDEFEFPPGSDESDFYAWHVYDGEIETNSPIIWLYLSAPKIAELDSLAQIRSTGDPRYPQFDKTHDAFLVLDDKVHRKVAVRHRGGFASRHAGRLKYSWKFTMPDWDLYNGRESLMVQGNMHWDDRWMRGDNGLQDKLCFMTFDRLGVPSPRTRFIRLMVNGEFFGYHVELEAIRSPFLERHGLTGSGDLYKHGRSFQAHHFPLSPGDYPDPRAYTKKSNDRNDYSSIREFCEDLAAARAGGPAAIQAYLEEATDVDNYRRYLAGIILSTHWDSTNNNIHVYKNDLDADRWMRFPWDMDITWGYSRRMPPPTQGHNLHPYDGTNLSGGNEFGVSALRDAFLRVPEYRDLLHDTLVEAITTTFTESEIHPVVDRIVEEDGAESQMDVDKWNALDGSWNWFPFTFHARYDASYVTSRRKYLAEFLDRDPLLSQASIQPRLAGPDDDLTFDVNALGNRYDGLHDLGPSNLVAVTLHLLVDDTETEHVMRAANGNRDDFWRVTVPALGRDARIHYRFSAEDDGGRRGVYPDPQRQGYAYFVLDLNTQAPRPDDIVINEIMYRAKYYNVEFVELKNHLHRAVDLSGWRFEGAAQSFTFPPGSIIGAGGYLVLSRDGRAVFEYYNIVDVVDSDLGFSLPNQSDTLSLRDGDGTLIDWVLYEDTSPWPEAPDGEGPSLELMDSRGANELGTSWAPSAMQGTPGRPNSVSEAEIPPQPGDEPPPPTRPLFHRGDVDGDGELLITDAVVLLSHLFLGGSAPSCREASDANNDGSVELTDAVALLNFLFLSGPPPAPPGPPSNPCGEDPDPKGGSFDLGCEAYRACADG